MEFILEPLYKILAQVSMSGHLVRVCPCKQEVEKRVNSHLPLPLNLLSFILLSMKLVDHQSSRSRTHRPLNTLDFRVKGEDTEEGKGPREILCKDFVYSKEYDT